MPTHEPGNPDCKACHGRAYVHVGCSKRRDLKPGVVHTVIEKDTEDTQPYYWIRCDACGEIF